MSGKGRQRRSRRTNTVDEQDDLIDHSDDNKSTISNDTDKNDSISKEDLKEATNGHENGVNVKNNTENKKQNDVQNSNEKVTKLDAGTENGNEKANEPVIIIEEPSDERISNENEKNGDDVSSEEMESLTVEAEEPELMFPPSEQNSDKSSELDSSPVLNRCKTRRSHTRNLPTPKTPKITELNGDNGEQETERKSVTPATQPEVIITFPDEEEQSEKISCHSIESVEESTFEKSTDSDLENASVFVHLGNDTTKNFDITVQSSTNENEIEQVIESNDSFLETTKGKTFGETLRCLSGRKSMRKIDPNTLRMYNSSCELHSDATDSPRRFTPSASSAGVKRKLDEEIPAEKRIKTESSPGFLSYLTSPFKNRSPRTEIPTATPKLTSFKLVNQEIPVHKDVTKSGLESNEISTSEQQKKWCSIM